MPTVSLLLVLGMSQWKSEALAASEIRIWISNSAAPIFGKIQGPFEKSTGIKLVSVGDPQKTNAVDYFKDVISGKAEAAVSSNSFTSWSQVMKEAGVQVPPEITHRVIGHDTLNIVVNKGTGVSELTEDEVKSIFLGKVTNWKQVKGADLPIKVVMVPGKKGTTEYVETQILAEQKPPAGTINVNDWQEMLDKVAGTPGAISYGVSNTAKSTKVTSVKVQPVLGRPMTMITRGVPSENVQKLIEFIRKNK